MIPVDPIIGRIVNNYVVERKLGQGGMGSVYRLRHQRLQNTYAALKVLLGEVALDERMTKRFEQEAQVAAAIGSHRVVKPLDIGAFKDGIPYIIMEYVNGESLEHVLAQRGPLLVADAVKIATRIADTMAIAHQKGIIHRDLKPANIMLGQEGSKEDAVKLLDFGVARVTGDLKLAETSEAAIIGTLGYISPEGASGLVVDGRADVFSLGVILYEMLTGELPFPRPNAQAAIINVLTLPTPRAVDRRPRHLDPISGDVEALMMRAMQKNPADRYTMDGLHSALVQSLAAFDHVPSAGWSVFAPRTVDPAAAATLSDSANQVGALLDHHVNRVPAVASAQSQPTRIMLPPAELKAPDRKAIRPNIPVLGGILGTLALALVLAIRILSSPPAPARRPPDSADMMPVGQEAHDDAAAPRAETLVKPADPKPPEAPARPKSSRREVRPQVRPSARQQKAGQGEELERPAGI